MKKADIKNGVIANVIVVDPADVPEWAKDWPTVTVEGAGWLYDGQKFTAPPDPPLYPDETSALFALHAWIKTFLAQFVGDATPEEVVSWPGKAIDAAAYIAGTANDNQKALIEIEATARGGTPMELANLIAANAAVYDPIIRAVPGLRRATVVALGAATTSDDREAVLTAAKAKAEALLAQVMAG
jgi:hypothetical protein